MNEDSRTQSAGGAARPQPDLLWAGPPDATSPADAPSLPWDANPDGTPVVPPLGEPATGRPTKAPAPYGPCELTEEVILRPRPDRPADGWRAWLHRITGGAVNLGPSRSELAWQDLVDRCRRPAPSGRRIAVLSRKGGVGKTTTTLMVGHTLAAVRPDRVLAIDGNPDAGTLGHRLTRQTGCTVADALARVGTITGYPDARGLTSQAPSRLEVLASPEDPHASRALRGADYQAVMDDLGHHYNVVLCDTGTGITDDANLGILDAVDQIVLVAGPALDSAKTAAMTLDWLDSNGGEQLVRDAVVVINVVAELGRVDVDMLSRHFEHRCRSVHRIPYDRHLETGAVTDPDMLAPATQEAWLRVSAAVADGFALPSGRDARDPEGRR